MSGAAASVLRSALDSSIQACADELNLAAKTCAEVLDVIFFSTKHPSHAR